MDYRVCLRGHWTAVSTGQPCLSGWTAVSVCVDSRVCLGGQPCLSAWTAVSVCVDSRVCLRGQPCLSGWTAVSACVDTVDSRVCLRGQPVVRTAGLCVCVLVSGERGAGYGQPSPAAEDGPEAITGRRVGPDRWAFGVSRSGATLIVYVCARFGRGNGEEEGVAAGWMGA